MTGSPQAPQPAQAKPRLLCPLMSTTSAPTACVEAKCALWSPRYVKCGLGSASDAIEAGFDYLVGIARDIKNKL